MKTIVSIFYAPLFWFGFIGAGVWAVGYVSAPWWTLILLALFAIAVSLVFEKYLPYETRWNGAQSDTPRDIAHALVNEGANIMSLMVWGGLLIVASSFFSSTGLWPSYWPVWLQVVLAILVADVGITLAHFASHRINFLWRLHAVHHSVTRMYGFNGLMKHPLHQAIEGVAGLGPLLLLGMPPFIAAILGYAIAINLLLQHSNVDIRLGWLRYFFAWAPVHRFHHIRYGTAGDVNFGFFTNLWDHLLGTAFYTQRYRITSDDLGIGSRPDFPTQYIAQLVDPFKPHTSFGAPPIPQQLVQAGMKSTV
jgi:sterol desaturase/sphingolipid hydroxylase (fatty acid hydroxylase superfamily)